MYIYIYIHICVLAYYVLHAACWYFTIDRHQEWQATGKNENNNTNDNTTTNNNNNDNAVHASACSSDCC